MRDNPSWTDADVNGWRPRRGATWMSDGTHQTQTPAYARPHSAHHPACSGHIRGRHDAEARRRTRMLKGAAQRLDWASPPRTTWLRPSAYGWIRPAIIRPVAGRAKAAEKNGDNRSRPGRVAGNMEAEYEDPSPHVRSSRPEEGDSVSWRAAPGVYGRSRAGTPGKSCFRQSLMDC